MAGARSSRRRNRPRRRNSYWPLFWRFVVGVSILVGLVVGVIAIQEKGQEVQEARQDPIRVESSDIAVSGCNAQSGIVKEDAEPNRTFDYYENKGLLIPSNGSLQVDFVSRVEDEELKVAPYALIKVTDNEPISHQACS